jgi:hypothetical protein
MMHARRACRTAKDDPKPWKRKRLGNIRGLPRKILEAFASKLDVEAVNARALR